MTRYETAPGVFVDDPFPGLERGHYGAIYADPPWAFEAWRGTKSVDLKAMAMSRCRDLGFDVNRHDAAEACGLLDYQLSVAGIIAPWREGVLERELRRETDGRAAA